MKRLLFSLMALPLLLIACGNSTKSNDSGADSSKDSAVMDKVDESARMSEHEKDSLASVEAEQLKVINEFYNYEGSSQYDSDTDPFYRKRMTNKLVKKLKKEYSEEYGEGGGLAMWRLLYPCMCDTYTKFDGVTSSGNNTFVVKIKHPKSPGQCDGNSKIELKMAKEGNQWKIDDYQILLFGSEKYW